MNIFIRNLNKTFLCRTCFYPYLKNQGLISFYKLGFTTKFLQSVTWAVWWWCGFSRPVRSPPPRENLVIWGSTKSGVLCVNNGRSLSLCTQTHTDFSLPTWFRLKLALKELCWCSAACSESQFKCRSLMLFLLLCALGGNEGNWLTQVDVQISVGGW